MPHRLMHRQWQLLRLRYRLLWAQVRLRRGRIALFVAGYFAAIFVAALFMLGGFGLAMASVRVGHAVLVARVLLGGMATIATMAAVLFGIGVDPAFSDSALRRYPLSPADRFAARHLTALLDPLWIVVAALYAGVALGFWAVGAGSAGAGLAAAILLVAANYLLARLAVSAIQWITSTRGGLLAAGLSLGLLMFAFSAAPVLGRMQALADTAFSILRFTPPFAAAEAMAGGSAVWLLLLPAWCGLLAAAIVGLERLPVPSGTAAAAEAEWDGPADRLAAHCGASAPLVSKTLKYYWRNNRARISLLLNLPALPLMLVAMGAGRKEPLLHFCLAMGVMGCAGFAGTFVMSANCFGYDGAGFRRYLLLPLPAEAVVRAASLVPLGIGAAAVVFTLAACLLLVRTPLSGRMVAMLASGGVGGLFFFHALALWVSVLAPSRSDGSVTFHNDYSLAANILSQGGLLGSLFGSQLLGFLIQGRVLRFWAAAPAFMLASAVFYAVTLRMAPAAFAARRERILTILERDLPAGGRLIT
jgi:hypothetical protein